MRFIDLTEKEYKEMIYFFFILDTQGTGKSLISVISVHFIFFLSLFVLFWQCSYTHIYEP